MEQCGLSISGVGSGLEHPSNPPTHWAWVLRVTVTPLCSFLALPASYTPTSLALGTDLMILVLYHKLYPQPHLLLAAFRAPTDSLAPTWRGYRGYPLELGHRDISGDP